MGRCQTSTYLGGEESVLGGIPKIFPLSISKWTVLRWQSKGISWINSRAAHNGWVCGKNLLICYGMFLTLNRRTQRYNDLWAAYQHLT